MEGQMEQYRKIRSGSAVIGVLLLLGLGFMLLFGAVYIWYGIKVAAASESSFSAEIDRFGQLQIDMEDQNFQAGSAVPAYASPHNLTNDIPGSYSAKRLQLLNLAISWILVLLPHAVIFWLAVRMLNRITSGQSPFCGSNIRSLRYIGWIMLFMGLMVKILYLLGIAYLGFGGRYRGMSYLFDFSSAFTGGLLLVLARIFQYGSYLQEEYDTTL